jgi:hypothetical protein
MSVWYAQSEPLNWKRWLMEPMDAPDKKNIPELLQEASGERDHAKVAVLVIEILKRLGERGSPSKPETALDNKFRCNPAKVCLGPMTWFCEICNKGSLLAGPIGMSMKPKAAKWLLTESRKSNPM